jgi:hypothetical protein
MVRVDSFLLAVLLASAAAYLGNRALNSRQGEGALLSSIPWWEEACKTGAAVLSGMPIPAVHTAFGVLELAYDLLRPSATGLLIGGLSLFGHLGFGLVTWFTAESVGSLLAGYAAASLLHMAWNRTLVRLATRWQAPGAPR